jgi:hypothetical protein
MGRRSTSDKMMVRRFQKELRPEDVREVVGRHFRSLTSKAGVNFAQYKAQQHEEEMVELLVGFTQDATLTANLRRQCALDVILVARGPQAPWLHSGETIIPGMASQDPNGPPGRTVGDDIESARRAADVQGELASLVMRKVPPAEWPEHVKLAAGEAIAYFELEGKAEEEAA